jgi:hypothetical protein
MLAASLLPVLLLVLALYIYDPAQIYHPPWGRVPTVHANLRIQIAGLARHGEFESIILGTSMLENSSADELSARLGSRFVNLSISAGDFYERGLMLGYLLERRSLRDVVWSLDFIYLNQRRGYRVFPLPTFEFLYDANPLNDMRLYMNRHFLGCLARGSQSEACVGRPVSLDRPNAWEDDPEHAPRFGGLDKWCQAIDHWQMRDVLEKLQSAVAMLKAGKLDYSAGGENEARAIAYVEQNLLYWAERFPQTRFKLVFPPYSRAKFALWYQQQPGAAATHRAVVRHLAQRAAALPNVELYGFEDESFPDAIEYYKDLDHFGPGINRRIAASLQDGRNRITRANVEAYLAVAARRSLAYDLGGLTERLLACQQEKSAPAGRQ